MKDKKLGRFEKKKGGCYWGTGKKKKARLSTTFTFLQPGEGVMHSPKDVDFGDFPPIFYAWPSCGHQAPFQNTLVIIRVMADLDIEKIYRDMG